MGFTPRLLTPRLLTPRLPTSVNHGNVGPSSLDWSDYPQSIILGVARSGSISCWFLHLFDGSVKTIYPAKRKAWGFTWLRERAAIYMRGYCVHYVKGM